MGFRRITGLASVGIVSSLLIAGCASKPPPANPPPAPGVYPQAVLTADQMAKLCQEVPDTCHRVQSGQPLTLGDVKAMTKAGLSPAVIINMVRNSRTVFHLTANQIIDLKKADVSDEVVDFLMSTPNSIAGSVPVPEPPANATTAAQIPPPPPPSEDQTPTPGPDYVWVPGDWVWNGGWIWVGGHWVVPPFPHAFWYRGGWVRGWRGFHRAPGRWR